MFFLLLVILLSRPEPVTDVPNTISGIMDTEPYCLRVQDFNAGFRIRIRIRMDPH